MAHRFLSNASVAWSFWSHRGHTRLTFHVDVVSNRCLAVAPCCYVVHQWSCFSSLSDIIYYLSRNTSKSQNKQKQAAALQKSAETFTWVWWQSTLRKKNCINLFIFITLIFFKWQIRQATHSCWNFTSARTLGVLSPRVEVKHLLDKSFANESKANKVLVSSKKEPMHWPKHKARPELDSVS